MTSSQTGIPQQDLLSEPFFQEIMNELEEPVNEETLEKQQRKYRAMKNDLYVFYHEGKQTLLKQIKEMSRLLEDRRHFRQLVIDRARKDPKRVEFERRYMKLLLDEIDDINQQIDLEQEKHVVLDEELELQKRQIWEIEKQTGGFEEYDRELVREGDVLKKRLHTLQSTYNEKLGKIIQYKEEILGFELEHKEYMDKARVLEVQLQNIRAEIVNTLKSVKPILKKRSEFMVKTTNTRNKAEKQQLLENEEMENNRRKMDHEAQLNKHIFEKKKPRPGAEESKAKPKAPGGADDLWDPILHVDDEDSQLPQ